MPTQKDCSVLLKAEFDIKGTNSLRAGRVSYFLCCTRGKVRNKTERSRITLNELLDPIIITLTISLQAEHFSKEVFDVTSQIIFQIKK